MNKFIKVLIGLVSCIIIMISACGIYVYSKLNQIHEVKGLEKPKTEDEAYDDESMYKDGVLNILLAGVDGNNLERGNRSDSMMILTIDKNNRNLRITSLARDTYVDIKGHSTEKLTHAYAYGGVDLLLDTIESNFGIKIDKYVTMNFEYFIKGIEVIGGVEVEVTDNDIEMLNKYIDECYEYDKRPDKKQKEYITTAGMHNLNGYQALAFSRIRYQDSAFARDGRQRAVVEACINKVQKQGLEETLKAIDTVISGIKTNFTPGETIATTSTILNIGTKNMKDLQFPVYQKNGVLPGKGWVIQWDKESNLEVLNEFIFNNNKIVD